MIKLIDIKPLKEGKGKKTKLINRPAAKSGSTLSLAPPRQLLLEAGATGPLTEGTWKAWDNNFDVRLDRRPAHMGGDQIHIRNRNGSEWAYRHTGGRSEGGKYTLSANKAVRDIVQHYFNVKLKESAEILIESIAGDSLSATWR